MAHPVDDDPVMASAIGRCSNQWTHVETSLARIFAALTQTDFAIAVTVFSVLKSSRSQSELLKKLSKIAPFMTADLRDQLTKYLKTYSALAEARNQLLHNPIGRSVENQVYIMLRSKTPIIGELPYETRPITPSEIDELSAKMRNFNRELIELHRRMIDAHFASLIPRATDHEGRAG
jgi:septation ring formation regulator EzrA